MSTSLGKVCKTILEQETLRYWSMSVEANDVRRVDPFSPIVSDAEDEISLIACMTKGRALRTIAESYSDREARLAGAAAIRHA
jgi:hypothetical protein